MTDDNDPFDGNDTLQSRLLKNPNIPTRVRTHTHQGNLLSKKGHFFCNSVDTDNGIALNIVS